MGAGGHRVGNALPTEKETKGGVTEKPRMHLRMENSSRG